MFVFLYRMKRLAFEKDSRPQNALIPVVEPRLRYVPHRCCPACLNDTRPMQKDPHRGQNPLLIPLLHSFRRMTARRRVDGKVKIMWFLLIQAKQNSSVNNNIQDCSRTS